MFWLVKRAARCTLLLVVGTPPTAGWAAPADGNVVTVQTADGRELTGVIDVRSDDDALWVRHAESPIVLSSAAPWNTIRVATLAGEAIAVEQLRAKHAGLATAGPDLTLEHAGPTREAMDQAPPAAAIRPARLRHLELVCVELANLDRDIEADGFELTIAAIGEDGRPAAVRGNLSVELYGERRALHEPGAEFPLLGRWSHAVAPRDFVDGTATYALPFRTAAPEWEFDLLPDAVITARLGAYGHGNYAASAPLLLREFNPLRDNLQQSRGTRFLPSELHGRRTINRFGPQHGLWLWWPR